MTAENSASNPPGMSIHLVIKTAYFPSSCFSLFSLLLLFNEILIKISFNTQATRQITLQSWDKMKLLTERMGSSDSHASIQKRKTSNFLSRHVQQGGHSAFQPHKPRSAHWLLLSLCLWTTTSLSLLEPRLVVWLLQYSMEVNSIDVKPGSCTS